MCSDLNCTIGEGLCHCGCGQPAPLAKKNATKYGHVKGEPVRYINGHYQRSTRLSPVDYIVDAVTGCWIWQRLVTPRRYGRMRVGHTMQYAHRVYYERYRGPIPAGLHLDQANTIRRGNGRACRECQRQAVRESQRKRWARLAASGETYPRKLIEGFPAVDYWVDPVSGCWVWQRHLGLEGYALKRRDGKKMPAHRYYYELYKGPIPEGLLLDHLCRNRTCVNPAHLEPVTPKENAARRAPRRRAAS
jgi:hypothetical protein